MRLRWGASPRPRPPLAIAVSLAWFAACGDVDVDATEVRDTADGDTAAGDTDGGEDVGDASVDAGLDGNGPPIPDALDAWFDAAPTPVSAPVSATFGVNLAGIGAGADVSMALDLAVAHTDGVGDITRATLRLPSNLGDVELAPSPVPVDGTMSSTTGQRWGTCVGTCDPRGDDTTCDERTPCTVFARGLDATGEFRWLGRCATHGDGALWDACDPTGSGPTPCDAGLTCDLTYLGGWSFDHRCAEPCTADGAIPCADGSACQTFFEDGPIGTCGDVFD